MNLMNFVSKWWDVDFDENGGKILTERHKTYIRPKVAGEIKGKLNLKFAKRQRVKAWKAAKAEKTLGASA